MTMTEEQWRAISQNNKTYDDVFWYAVKSTKIFCRPSCPSRLPKRENIETYDSVSEPLKLGFRPCKRCRPLNEPVSNQEWVDEIELVLTTCYQQDLTLSELASLVHGSESYLRHVYKVETGQTPHQRLMDIRLSNAAELLKTTDKPVAKIAEEVGMFNVPHFIQQFKKAYGDTPNKYRHLPAM